MNTLVYLSPPEGSSYPLQEMADAIVNAKDDWEVAITTGLDPMIDYDIQAAGVVAGMIAIRLVEHEGD